MPHPETAKDKGDAEANNKREMCAMGATRPARNDGRGREGTRTDKVLQV